MKEFMLATNRKTSAGFKCFALLKISDAELKSLIEFSDKKLNAFINPEGQDKVRLIFSNANQVTFGNEPQVRLMPMPDMIDEQFNAPFVMIGYTVHVSRGVITLSVNLSNTEPVEVILEPHKMLEMYEAQV